MPAAAARTMTVLSVLASSSEPMTVAQLAAETKIARASLGRLLESLRQEGGVTVDEAGRFGPSLLLWGIGAATMNRLGVRDTAFPYLTDISGRIPAHVSLCVPAFPRAVAVETWSTVGGHLTSRFVWRSMPMLGNAAGRVMAAHECEERREMLLAEPIRQRTPFTRTDPVELRAELDRVREQGYCAVDREDMDDISGFAVALFGEGGAVRGSVSFARSGPLDATFVQNFAPLAVGVAERISWELGWREGSGSRVS